MEYRASDDVLRLWHAVPQEVRLSFSRHPVDEVRALERRIAELEAANGPLIEYVGDLVAAQARIAEQDSALAYAVAFMRDQGYDFSPPEEVEGDEGAPELHRFARDLKEASA